MNQHDTLGTIITFYSWKGGTGRTMSMANVGCALARMGKRVLLVDFDLEAPGLDKYFQNDEAKSFGIRLAVAEQHDGVLGLLEQASRRASSSPTAQDWRKRLKRIDLPRSTNKSSQVNGSLVGSLQMLPAGRQGQDYSARLANFSWNAFFRDAGGGTWLEKLRHEWIENFDFTLVDSRTGLTDSGGICTVILPDILVLAFTANDQSLEGGLAFVDAVQRERDNYAYNRAPLAIVPLLSRWDGDAEVDLGSKWTKRIGASFGPYVSGWLPKQFEPRQFIEKVRVPHVARFSFGEPLPVISHSVTDPALPGLPLSNLAQFLATRLTGAAALIDPPSVVSEENELYSLLADEGRMQREIGERAGRLGQDSPELLRFLNDLALLLEKVGNYARAKPLYERALAIAERAEGPEHPSTGRSLSNLAGLLKAQGDYAGAQAAL